MDIKDKIKDEHFKIYAKYNWSHKPDCICKQWQSPEIIAEVEKPDTLETIEKRSETEENFTTDNLGF